MAPTRAPAAAGAERIRQRKHGDRRLPAGELFFDGRWGEPLDLEAAGAGDCARALEAVRMGPSATNKQPWRIVRGGGVGGAGGGAGGGGRDWHFPLRRTKGYGRGSLAFKALRIADLQRVDLGIAMCHFELVAREAGLVGRWVVDDTGLALPDGVEYTATWREGGRGTRRLVGGGPAAARQRARRRVNVCPLDEREERVADTAAPP